MIKRNVSFLVFLPAFALILGVFLYSVFISEEKPENITADNRNYSKISVGGKEHPILLAESPEELSRGLGGVDNLEEAGMLFVFEKSDYHEIWMQNMKFPIDILWLDENFRIIDMKRNVSPDTFPETFRPARLSRHVFEAKAGFADNFDLRVGEILRFLP